MTLRNRAVLVLFALALPAAAQMASISGKVVNDSGSGIGDLKVSATNQATKVEREVRTNADGSFSLETEPGAYTMAVEKPGRGVFGVRDVDLTSGQTRTLNFQLSTQTDNRNFRYMFYGFLAAWLVLVVYVISLISRERGLKKQMEDLRRMVESERR
jgi:CcmD family protein